MNAWTPTETERALLNHVIARNGSRHQEVKAAEEYAEASAAIARFSNMEDDDLGNLAAELADTEIMQAQLCEIFPELPEIISQKRAIKLAAMAARFGFPETNQEQP